MKRNYRLTGGILWILSFFLAGMVHAQVIGYWRFDEQTPGNTADLTAGALLDSSGNARPGTMSDAGVLYVSGNTNYAGTSALRFTLGPDHVTVPDTGIGNFNFSSSQSFTLEAMIRTTNIGQDGVGCMVAKQGAVAGVSGEWWWRINANGTQQFFINDTTTSRNVSGTRKLNDGQWHLVTAEYDATAQQVRVYVDYALDGAPASAVLGNIIGNDKDLWIGAFQAGNRQFDGDIDFVRISTGALLTSDFVQPLTYIANVVPVDGASFFSAATASFSVKSPTIGVTAANIHAILSGTNISSQLQLTGNINDWTASLPALTANQNYRLEISVTDQAGHQAGQTNTFNTFTQNLFFIEAEDYNFAGGQYIDNPQLSSSPGPNNYLYQVGVEGIDYHKVNPPVATQYRSGDQVGTFVSSDALRQNYIDAQAVDPGVVDYNARDFINGEWVNYTRTFPANTYHVYARVSKSGTVPIVMNLDEVTAGSTTNSQTTSPIGVFRGQPTGSAQAFAFIPLTDALGNEVGVSLNGVKTLKLSMVSGTTGLNANYLVFVPQGSQVPFLASVSPASAANNESSNVVVQATIRNADTQVNTGSIQLKLDGTSVTPAITGTATGTQISYTPFPLAVGLHTVTLIFTDSASSSITNKWQFWVANPLVRGYWNFNEKTPGNLVSITNGAILDASGNSRNGTANDPTMQYVTGSFNYGNSSALRFTSGSDRVVIPDPSGSFNFQGSFTWEAVLRSTSTGTNLAILAKNGTGDGEGEFWWRLPGSANGVQSVGMNDGTGAKFLAGTNSLTDGAWHHVAVVYDTNTAQIRLYADYKLEATLTNVLFTNSIGRPADLQIGGFIGGGNDFDGDIDAIRISNGALTNSQFIQTTVALPPIVKAVRPNTNATHVFPMPSIQMDVQNRDTQVVPGSCKMFIDGNDVSAGITVTSSVSNASIQYKPASPLANGLHTVVVRFGDTASPANSVTNQWSFTVVNNEPVLGFYQFNEKAPGDTADTTPGAILDSSVNLRHGTASKTGLPYVIGSPSYGGSSALEFTVAAANHVSIPDPGGVFNFTPTQSITLEAIIKTTTIGQAQVGSILSKQSATPPEWWWRINTTGFQQFNVNDGTGAKSVSGTKKLNDGQWHHVAVIYDGTAKQLRAYVDYVQDGNTVATTYTSLSNIIGTAQDLWVAGFQAGNRLFEGDIDAVRVTGAPLDVSWFIPLGGIVANVSIQNVSVSSNSVSFSFVTETGRSYVVQSTTSLGGAWTDVETVAGDGTRKTVNYPASGAQKFFRINVR
ncbi:LamG-like jellyroll fold domain-containing protein [Pedosphaera parvula]|nr:LamG-like jellyroll fold domain-containing protein [Pedosphaera parvula]